MITDALCSILDIFSKGPPSKEGTLKYEFEELKIFMSEEFRKQNVFIEKLINYQREEWRKEFMSNKFHHLSTSANRYEVKKKLVHTGSSNT